MTKRRHPIDPDDLPLPSVDSYQAELMRRNAAKFRGKIVKADDLDVEPLEWTPISDWDAIMKDVRERLARVTGLAADHIFDDAISARCKHGLLLDGAYCQTCLRERLAAGPDGADAFAHFAWDPAQDPRPPRPEHWNCRSTTAYRWGDGTPLTEEEIDLINGTYRGGEIITDPADQRGMRARRIN